MECLVEKGVFRMNSTIEPEDWGREDHLIVQALHGLPVPKEARKRAHHYLLQQASPSAFDHAASGLRAASIEDDKQPQVTTFGRRRWLAWGMLVGIAASALVAITFWKWLQPLYPAQLIAVCIDQIEKPGDWRTIGDSPESLEVTAFQNVLNKVLTVHPGSPIEYRPMESTVVSGEGRLWKLPIIGRREIYILEFDSPRTVEGVSTRIQMLSGISRGWSMAAVVEGDRLFVFMSKDRLRDSLNLSPLA
jgi:hypothetical protein